MNSLCLATALFLCFGVAEGAFAQRLISLDEAMRIAREQAPSLRSARLAYQGALSSAESADRSLRSTVDLALNAPLYTDNTSPVFNPTTGTSDLLRQRESLFGGGLTVSQPLFWTGGNLSVTGNLFRRNQTDLTGTGSQDFIGTATVRLDQPLFKANELRLRSREAEMSLDLARANYVSASAALNYRIKSLFFGLYQAEQELVIKQSEVAASDSAYQQALGKLKAGLIAEVDALQLEADFAAARTDLYDRERRLEASRRELLLALGLPLSENVRARLDKLEHNDVRVDPRLAVEKALSGRADLMISQFDIERSEIAEDRLSNRRSINASLKGNFGASRNAIELATITQQPYVNRVLDLSISIPLFDWGAHSLEMDAAYSRIEQTRVSLAQKEREIEQEVLSVIEQLNAARKQIEAADKTLQVAEKVYQVSSERFAIGKITSQDLSLAQQRLTRAKLAALSALVSERLALADLTQKTLFDFERNEAVNID